MILSLLVLLVVAAAAAETKKQHHHHQQEDDVVNKKATADELRRKKLAEQARDTHDTHDYIYTSRGTWQTVGVSVLMTTIGGLCALFILLCCLEPACGACRKLWWIVTTMVAIVFFVPRWLLNKLCCCGRLSGPGRATDAAVEKEKKRRTLRAEANLAEAAVCQVDGCAKTRLLISNYAKRAVLIAQCEEHMHTAHGGRAQVAAALERGQTRYTCNFYFLKEPFSGPGRREAQKRLQDVIEWAQKKLEAEAKAEAEAEAEAEAKTETTKGFIYVFSSKDDGAARPEDASKPWFYKIGETTLAHAVDRVNEWDKLAGFTLLFENIEGVGWWRTNNAPVAEALVHAVLASKRYVRFNSLRDKDEIEWFLAPLNQVQETIARVVKRVDAAVATGGSGAADLSSLKVVA